MEFWTKLLDGVAVGDRAIIAVVLAIGVSCFFNECANRETNSHTIYQCERSCESSHLMAGVEIEGNLVCRCR